MNKAERKLALHRWVEDQIEREELAEITEATVQETGTGALLAQGTAWSGARKLMFTAVESKDGEREIVITDLATDDPFEGLS